MKLERREIRHAEKWPKGGVFFDVRRGSFELPGAMLRRAELTGDDFEIRRAFAKGLPDGAQASRREKIPGGGLRITWRRIRVFGLFKRDALLANVGAVDLDPEELAPVTHELRREMGVALDAPRRFAHGEVDEPSERTRELDAAFASEPIHVGFERWEELEGRGELAAELEPPPDDFALR